MAETITYGSDAGASGAATSLGLPNATFAGGERIIVGVSCNTVTATETVTDGTNTYNQIDGYANDASHVRLALFEALNVTAGTYTITANYSASVGNRAIFFLYDTGSDTNAAQTGTGQSQANPGTGTDAVTSGNMTPTGQPNAVVGVSVTFINGSTVTAGTGFTNLGVWTGYNSNAGDTSRVEYKDTTSTGVTAATFTCGGATETLVTIGGVIGASQTVDFVGTPLIGNPSLTVSFTDLSSGSPASWLWEKNDGSGWVNFSGTPTSQNPTETFAAGTWSVRLTATYGSTPITTTKTNYVAVFTSSVQAQYYELPKVDLGKFGGQGRFV